MRAEQAWVRQSRLPILELQSLNAVLMSGMERQVWGRGAVRGRVPDPAGNALAPGQDVVLVARGWAQGFSA